MKISPPEGIAGRVRCWLKNQPATGSAPAITGTQIMARASGHSGHLRSKAQAALFLDHLQHAGHHANCLTGGGVQGGVIGDLDLDHLLTLTQAQPDRPA